MICPRASSAVAGDPHLERHVLLGELLLGLPDVADLGDAVDADRLQLRHGVHRLPAGVVRRLTALFRGGGGQGGEADDVAHRVDVRHRGAEELIDHDPAALVRGEATPRRG